MSQPTSQRLTLHTLSKFGNPFLVPTLLRMLIEVVRAWVVR